MYRTLKTAEDAEVAQRVDCFNRMPNLIILYDGVCGLCNRLNQFLIKRDQKDHLSFVSLQSDLGRKILLRHRANPDDLDTVYVVENYEQPNERVLVRSDAILRAVVELPGIWKAAAIGKLIPRPVRDLLYKVVAKNRYRVFGKYETCLLPDPKYRKKFLDV